MLPKSSDYQVIPSVQVILKDVDDSSYGFVEMYLCSFCETEFDDVDELREHQENCFFLPSSLACVLSRTSTPLSPPAMRPVTRSHSHEAPYPKHSVSQARYMTQLNLVSTATTKQMRRPVRVSCDVIDVAPLPRTPVTPKSPKALMSQMSCENEPLSPRFTRGSQIPLSPCPNPRRFSFLQNRSDEDVIEISSDDESSDDFDDVESTGTQEDSSRKRAYLLNIDISSPLGVRVREHIDSDHSENASINGNAYESYCRTPIKNSFLQKLRDRGSEYPVTFRHRRRYKHCHAYKFTSSQRREFSRVFDTGLDKHSRRLKRLMRPCSVCLRRLSKEELKKWIRPEKVAVCSVEMLRQSDLAKWLHPPPTSSKYTSELSLKLPQLSSILGFKTTNAPHPITLKPGQTVSEGQQSVLKPQKPVLCGSLNQSASRMLIPYGNNTNHAVMNTTRDVSQSQLNAMTFVKGGVRTSGNILQDRLYSSVNQSLTVDVGGDTLNTVRRRLRWRRSNADSPSSTSSSWSLDGRWNGMNSEPHSADDSESRCSSETSEAQMPPVMRLRKFSSMKLKQVDNNDSDLSLYTNNNGDNKRTVTKPGSMVQPNLSRNPIGAAKAVLDRSDNRLCNGKTASVPRTRSLCSTVLRSGRKISSPVKGGVRSWISNNEDEDVIFVGELVCIDD